MWNFYCRLYVCQFNTNTAWKIETAGIFLYDTTDERCPVQELLDFLEPKLLAKKYKADYERRYGNE